MTMPGKPPRGTTIVEMVLYMGLLSIFLVIFFNLFSTVLSTRTRSDSVSLLETNGSFIISKLTRDINLADSIVTPAAIGTPSSQMVLRIGASDFSYTVSGGRLVLQNGALSSYLNDVDTAVAGFEVMRIGTSDAKNSLDIRFTLQSLLVEENSSPRSLNFHTAAALR